MAMAPLTRPMLARPSCNPGGQVTSSNFSRRHKCHWFRQQFGCFTREIKIRHRATLTSSCCSWSPCLSQAAAGCSRCNGFRNVAAKKNHDFVQQGLRNSFGKKKHSSLRNQPRINYDTNISIRSEHNESSARQNRQSEGRYRKRPGSEIRRQD